MIRTMTATEVITCRWCGARLGVEWAEITAMSDPEPVWIPSRVTCPTRGCGPRCPVCRREPGDIHGPECGEVMAAKLGDLTPCTITRADCGERMTSERGAT